MKTDIVMPKMGESVVEGTIIKWHKKVGDEVKRDEIIFEIATDKVDTEVPSPMDGTITEILVKENETVEVDTVVARMSTDTGDVVTETQSEKEVVQEVTEISDVIEKNSQSSKPKKSVAVNSNKFYSPLVMNIAQKENVGFDELENITGTGLNGRVTKKDILAYINLRGEKKTKPAETSHIDYSPNSGATEVIPMDNIRKRIKEHMVNSRDTSVHVTAVTEVDMSSIHSFLELNKEKFFKDDGIKLTYLAFIARAVVKALKEYPLMNASLNGDNIIQKKYINLGIAVAVEPNGLIVPNIKNADDINTKGLSRAIADLSNRARSKKLLPDDVVDGTFSLTNYGVFGSLFGTPIINQPEVGILGVGAVQKKPVVVTVDGQDLIAIKPMMYLSLSHDHRLVDGMLGGKFLKYVKDYLENFDTSKI
jgi:2-oxoglutarate dehydrogenase complex dihydrolipoamide succinyltransferase (E2) component